MLGLDLGTARGERLHAGCVGDDAEGAQRAPEAWCLGVSAFLVNTGLCAPQARMRESIVGLRNILLIFSTVIWTPTLF